MRRQFGAVDLCKFLCALLIVSAHYLTDYATGRVHPVLDLGISVYVIVVPFFFACSGYFLFSKVRSAQGDGKGAVLSYVRRIAVMYGLWSVVYVAFRVLTWIRFGTSAREVLSYALEAVFYSTYDTIWYLPALCVGILLTWWLLKRFGPCALLIAAAVCYVVGCLGVSYRYLPEQLPVIGKLFDGYDAIFHTTRSGLFHGFPLVALGAYIARREQQGDPLVLGRELVGCVFWGICFVAEALAVKRFLDAVNVNTLLTLVPFTYHFLRACLSIPLVSGKWLQWMRAMSTAVFLCQRIWLTALPELFPGTFFEAVLRGDVLLGWIYVLSVTVATAALLVRLAKRSRLVRAMC